MKKLFSYFLVVMLIPAFVLTGCKDDNDDITPADKGNFTTLKNYLVDQNLEIGTILADGWVVAPAPMVDGSGIVDVENECTIPDYHVFDIRGESDFNNGHIKGAINVALTDIVTTAADYSDKPILVVCKTGQTAGRGAMALRLSGFQAKVMKFGMSYWNTAFDLWTGKVNNFGVSNPNWVTTDGPELPTNELTQCETTSTDPVEILAANINTMLAAGEWGLISDDILANPTAYNTYNFWKNDEEYIGLGHFVGAYQFKPINFDNINALPAEEDTYIYCFTGQTSSFVVSYLQVLGYTNAKSILFGANRIIHDDLDAYNPIVTWHHSYDYTFEVNN